MQRIEQKFTELKSQNKTAFVGYICAGDPNYEDSLAVLKSLPGAGVDIIELGVPFLDPAGDGPVIEEAAKRAIAAGMTLKKTLQMAQEFRKNDQKTPLVLMGYYNPILHYGLDKIFTDAEKSGIDAMLIVDLPMEEEVEIAAEVAKTNLVLIHLIAPTTSEKRAQEIAKKSKGFLYLVSMLGITGTKAADLNSNKENLQKLRQVTDLPIVIGFGIKTPQQAGEFSRIGVDGVVIGSEVVKEIDKQFSSKSKEIALNEISVKIREFAQAISNG